MRLRTKRQRSSNSDEKYLATGQIAVGPLFKDLYFRYTGRGWHNRLIRYRLYVPDDLLPNKKYPMIVWLHGRGDGGNENAMQLNHLGFTDFLFAVASRTISVFLSCRRMPARQSLLDNQRFVIPTI